MSLGFADVLISVGIDAVQQSVYGQGKQSDTSQGATGINDEKQKIHSAVDEAHPEQISEFMRAKYHSRTEEQDREDGRA